MKICNRFHFADVEAGDRLFLGDGSAQEFNGVKDPDIEIVVTSAYNTHNFGPVVRANNGETYYLDDYGVVGSLSDE